MKKAIGQAMINWRREKNRVYQVDLIEMAGGKILEVHSIRPDGSIRSEDLPDLIIP